MNARRNWERLKMRIMVIQKFSSLSNFKKKLEVELEDSDPEEPHHVHAQTVKWFIINSESRNK